MVIFYSILILSASLVMTRQHLSPKSLNHPLSFLAYRYVGRSTAAQTWKPCNHPVLLQKRRKKS
ncbi:hypothetical protein HMPREF9413_3298 [Paenibacillus sp. HGF7]|nr:hypothetical protein HMPREF9413_3298 [Paenibacillus sp. HGF7]